jgi:hypothetical protein
MESATVIPLRKAYYLSTIGLDNHRSIHETEDI